MWYFACLVVFYLDSFCPVEKVEIESEKDERSHGVLYSAFTFLHVVAEAMRLDLALDLLAEVSSFLLSFSSIRWIVVAKLGVISIHLRSTS